MYTITTCFITNLLVSKSHRSTDVDLGNTLCHLLSSTPWRAIS